MRSIVVGIANVQTSVPVGSFPLDYAPTRYLPGRVDVTTGGVGFNVARMLARLQTGRRADPPGPPSGPHGGVRLAAPLGEDVAGRAVLADAAACGVDTTLCESTAGGTPRSVVLVDDAGRRQVHTDLRGALDHRFSPGLAEALRGPADLVVLGNLDACRPLLPVARAAGRTVAVDLQDIQGLDNPYDRDFLRADILSMSHERIAHPLDFLRALRARTPARLVVLTLGAHGSLALGDGLPDETPWHTPAAPMTGPFNTTGAGDAFFAGLLTALIAERLPAVDALRAATRVAATALDGGRRAAEGAGVS